MLVESHVLDEIFTRRYRGPKPRYALVISHGIGAHGGIYDVFCTHHAAKGVDIWSYDAPGHGRSTTTRPRGQ
jgi:alpha-beta hydrolase superfamily lysophospholipase